MRQPILDTDPPEAPAALLHFGAGGIGPGVRMTKIVLLEDNDWNRDKITCRPVRSGIVGHGVADGQPGIESTPAERPDFIRTEFRLPSLVALEAASRFEANPLTMPDPAHRRDCSCFNE